MTQAHVSILIILLALILYVFEILPIPVTAMGCAALMVVFKVAPASAVWAAFGQDSVLLMGSMTLIGSTLFSTGAVGKATMLIEKLGKGNIKITMILLFTVSCFASAFLNNTTVTTMFLPLLLGIIVKANSAKETEQKYVQALSVMVGVGGMATLIGTGVNVAASSLMKDAGIGEISFFEFVPLAIPMYIVSILYIFTIGHKIADKMVEKRPYRSSLVRDFIKEYKDNSETPGTTKNNPKMLMSVLVMLVTVIGLITQSMHGISTGTVGIIGATLLIATGCVNFKDACTRISLSTLLTLGGTLGCAKGLADSGGGALIANFILNLFGSNLTPYMAFVVLTITSLILSQFMSNTGTVGILIPIGIAVFAELGASPIACVYGITLAASCSFATPMASHIQAMIIDWGSYKFVDYLKYSGPITLILTAILIVLIPVLYPI